MHPGDNGSYFITIAEPPNLIEEDGNNITEKFLVIG